MRTERSDMEYSVNKRSAGINRRLRHPVLNAGHDRLRPSEGRLSRSVFQPSQCGSNKTPATVACSPAGSAADLTAKLQANAHPSTRNSIAMLIETGSYEKQGAIYDEQTVRPSCVLCREPASVDYLQAGALANHFEEVVVLNVTAPTEVGSTIGHATDGTRTRLAGGLKARRRFSRGRGRSR